MYRRGRYRNIDNTLRESLELSFKIDTEFSFSVRKGRRMSTPC